GEVVPIRVNGLINQSVLLSPSVDTSHPVQHVYWNFQAHIMASFINSQLTVIRNEFKGRLEMLDDGRALRIGQLTLNDSGLYSVTMTFMDKTLDASYNLTVYEPVPTPSIRFKSMEKTTDWCNVTLRCSIPRNTSSLSYTWKYRHGDQLYNNSGETVQMSLQRESWDMEVLCIVHNPADRKNVSLAKFCTKYSGKHRKTGQDKKNRGYYSFLALLVVPLVFLGWYLLDMKKRRRKEPQSIDSEQMNYAELIMAPRNVPTQVSFPKTTPLPPSQHADLDHVRYNRGTLKLPVIKKHKAALLSDCGRKLGLCKMI
ncbi:PREDICTED: SLAM family member 9-like, partial [Nanorana parkeri]|uniref:SLAM family member 9-like n=1 Tax=Nanorana parkeri TaxID=125878 RepID=UPI000854F199